MQTTTQIHPFFHVHLSTTQRGLRQTNEPLVLSRRVVTTTMLHYTYTTSSATPLALCFECNWRAICNQLVEQNRLLFTVFYLTNPITSNLNLKKKGGAFWYTVCLFICEINELELNSNNFIFLFLLLPIRLVIVSSAYAIQEQINSVRKRSINILW